MWIPVSVEHPYSEAHNHSDDEYQGYNLRNASRDLLVSSAAPVGHFVRMGAVFERVFEIVVQRIRNAAALILRSDAVLVAELYQPILTVSIYAVRTTSLRWTPLALEVEMRF